MPNGERIMNTEEIKKFFTRDNIKKFWKKVWGTEPEPVDESVFDDPDRYVKFDEAEDEKYWEDKKRFKREKTLLTWRRICVSIISICVLFQLTTGIVNSVSLFINTNKFLSCVGKDVCTYLGPKMYHDVGHIARIYKHSNGNIYILKSDFKNIYPEYYDFQKHKFMSIKKNLLYKNNPFLLKENNKGDLVLFYYNKPNLIYDIKDKKVTAADNILFRSKIKEGDFFANYRYLTDYAPGILIFENCIKSFDGVDRFYGNNTTLTSIESSLYRLYFFDVNTNSFEKLPSLKNKIKHMPLASDFIILNSGKIIIPVRYRHDSMPNALVQNTDEILEKILIYDPETNIFYDNPIPDGLKNYLFNITTSDNKVIFISKDNSYIFDDKTNKFVLAEKKEIIKNKILIKQLEVYLDFLMEVKIEEFKLYKAISIIPLKNNKFLLTCGGGHPDQYRYKSNLWKTAAKSCRNTVIFDYETAQVKKGPTLKWTFPSKIIRVSDNEIFLFHGWKLNKYPGNEQIFNKTRPETIRIQK